MQGSKERRPPPHKGTFSFAFDAYLRLMQPTRRATKMMNAVARLVMFALAFYFPCARGARGISCYFSLCASRSKRTYPRTAASRLQTAEQAGFQLSTVDKPFDTRHPTSCETARHRCVKYKQCARRYLKRTFVKKCRLAEMKRNDLSHIDMPGKDPQK